MVAGKLAHDLCGVDKSEIVECHFLFQAASIINRELRRVREAPVPPVGGLRQSAFLHCVGNSFGDSPLGNLVEHGLAIFDKAASLPYVRTFSGSLTGWLPERRGKTRADKTLPRLHVVELMPRITGAEILVLGDLFAASRLRIHDPPAL